MPNWTVELGEAGTTGGLTEYPKSVPVMFLQRLNGIGFFSAAVFDTGTNPDPARDDLIRFVWDKGGSEEQTHFEGVVTDVRRHAELRKVFRVRGLSAEGLLWQSGIGDVRDWRDETPFTIAQNATTPPPLGLLRNAQGNLRPVGTTTLQYGTATDIPWKVTSSLPGQTMDFRAASDRAWVNVQRLAMQARHTQTEYPSWAESPPGETDAHYGLDAFVRIEADAEPRFYLVGRRERDAEHLEETWAIPAQVHEARRGTEGLTAAEAIKVVGSGSGKQRIESAIVGSGGIEGVLADKSIVGVTEAENQAKRLSTLLDPSKEVLTGHTTDHDIATRVGDRVTFTETGQSDATLRVFTLGYRLEWQRFIFVAGRPRPLPEEPFTSVNALTGGHAQGAQPMQGNQVGSLDQTRTGVVDGDTVEFAIALDPALLVARGDSLVLRLNVIVDPGADVDMKVEAIETSSLTQVDFETERVTADGGGNIRRTVVIPQEWIQTLASAIDVVDQLDVVVGNTSGASMDIRCDSQVWLRS